MENREKGFTLIELSIALVIIGLIAGGILFGRSLIRASEFRSILSDLGRFEAAQMTFRNKYNCIAGDCKDADSFGIWNIGNGNGYVEHYSYNLESYQFWQHLASSELISGSYSGTGDSTPVLGENIPSSRILGVGYSLFTPAPVHLVWSPNQDTKGLPRSVYDTVYVVGRTGERLTYSGFISPIEAKALDIK